MARPAAPFWTRRRTLAALAVATAAPALPARPAGAAAAVPPGLARICTAAAATPWPARLGAAAAAGRAPGEIAAALVARLGPGATERSAADWRAALVAGARRDLARGDTVTLCGRPVMRTEALVLALGHALGRGPIG